MDALGMLESLDVVVLYVRLIGPPPGSGTES